MCSDQAPGACQGIFSGEIADFNIWSRVWSVSEMLSFTKCQAPGRGDILNWSEAKWQAVNVRWELSREFF